MIAERGKLRGNPEIGVWKALVNGGQMRRYFAEFWLWHDGGGVAMAQAPIAGNLPRLSAEVCGRPGAVGSGSAGARLHAGGVAAENTYKKRITSMPSRWRLGGTGSLTKRMARSTDRGITRQLPSQA